MPTPPNIRLLCCFVLSVVTFTVFADQSSAQLFGERNLGQPIRAGNANRVMNQQAGTLQGNERFMRDNRSRSDFVGADRRDQTGFVGSEQSIGVGRVPAATESLRPPRNPAARINRPLRLPQQNELYLPRLLLDLETPRADQAMQGAGLNRLTATESLAAELTARLSRVSESPIEVSVEGRTATLRGEAASLRQKELLEILVSFEAGIDQLQNELTIAENR